MVLQPLVQLMERIAIERGSPIKTYGIAPPTLRKGPAEGLVEAQDQAFAAQRSLLGTHARRKFGDEAAARLGALLEVAEDADQFAEIAQLIVDCGTDEEILVRLR